MKFNHYSFQIFFLTLIISTFACADKGKHCSGAGYQNCNAYGMTLE